MKIKNFYLKIKDDAVVNFICFLWIVFFVAIGFFVFSMIENNKTMTRSGLILKEITKDESINEVKEFNIDSSTLPRVTYTLYKSKQYNSCYLVKDISGEVNGAFKFKEISDIPNDVATDVLGYIKNVKCDK